MKEYTVRAEKAPTPDDPGNWDVKVAGMNAQEAKEWIATSFGRNWIIRYTLPSEESYPCFLLAKRSSEKTASMLAEGTADYIEKSGQFNVKCGSSSSNVPGYSYTFIMRSNA